VIGRPASRLSAVELSEPPTGRPRSSPQPMLAMPMAKKSREMLLRAPFALGTFWLTPADCTATITATESAPVNNEMSNVNAGSCSDGTPPLIVAMSPAVRTLWSWSSKASAEAMTSAARMPKLPRRVRGSQIASTSVTSATPVDAGSIWFRWPSRSSNRAIALSPVAA
jgi:hypothetical protein